MLTTSTKQIMTNPTKITEDDNNNNVTLPKFSDDSKSIESPALITQDSYTDANTIGQSSLQPIQQLNQAENKPTTMKGVISTQTAFTHLL
ncbi:hypothetical protein RCL_jg23180.t1 [Rhizophagus clarus]|uniref:Uncharacterized protein n=1 Tax=Rhizophagus clarus TaxID=94130 RepID=A0A8H3QK14_9GLOM|nr:hypothetical protein RCL_jg23180.t1 [Rhizophagus clarus]